MFSRAFALVLAACVLASLVNCGSSQSTASKPTLRVLCGSSMADPIQKIAKDFEQQQNVEVRLDLGGCETLLPKIRLDVAADIFVCHDPYEENVRTEHKWAGSTPVGALEPVLVVKPGNPKQIKSLQDLTRADLRLGIGDPRYSTCGEMFVKLLEEKNLKENVMPQVKAQMRTHSELANGLITGPLDAVVIWNFAAMLHEDKLEVVHVPEKYQTVRVTIVGLSKSENPALRDKFIEFCKSEKVQTLFKEYGYVAGSTK
ncbi:MAG TPA: substrate-binding domain-containing protein [Planctomycetota bacterium]|jgi:molybdate transport system substrate-binding protein